MIDATQFSAWVVVALFFVAAGLLLGHSFERATLIADRLAAWSNRFTSRPRSEAEEDEAFARAELQRILREDRLRSDLERLRHLIAVDTYMSATRQIANRMAYRQVLAEAATLPPELLHNAPVRSRTVGYPGPAGRRSSGPETLDIHWR